MDKQVSREEGPEEDIEEDEEEVVATEARVEEVKILNREFASFSTLHKDAKSKIVVRMHTCKNNNRASFKDNKFHNNLYNRKATFNKSNSKLSDNNLKHSVSNNQANNNIILRKKIRANFIKAVHQTNSFSRKMVVMPNQEAKCKDNKNKFVNTLQEDTALKSIARIIFLEALTLLKRQHLQFQRKVKT